MLTKRNSLPPSSPQKGGAAAHSSSSVKPRARLETRSPEASEPAQSGHGCRLSKMESTTAWEDLGEPLPTGENQACWAPQGRQESRSLGEVSRGSEGLTSESAVSSRPLCHSERTYSASFTNKLGLELQDLLSGPQGAPRRAASRQVCFPKPRPRSQPHSSRAAISGRSGQVHTAVLGGCQRMAASSFTEVAPISLNHSPH